MIKDFHGKGIFSGLPSGWSHELENEFLFVKKQGFILTSPEVVLKNLTLGVLLILDLQTKDEIYNFIVDSLPKTLFPKLYIQPRSGYHFSIQTSKKLDGDINKLTRLVTNYFRRLPKIEGDIFTIYPSDNSLLGIGAFDSDTISSMRSDLGEIFTSCGFPPFFDKSLRPDHFKIWSTRMWLSLVRPTETFTQEEIELTLKLPKRKFTKIVFNKIDVCFNDPFFTTNVSVVKREINLI